MQPPRASPGAAFSRGTGAAVRSPCIRGAMLGPPTVPRASSPWRAGAAQDRGGWARTASSLTSVPQPGPSGSSRWPFSIRGRDGHEVVVPGHRVGIDLHDPEVRHDGAEVGAHHGREVAVEVVRRDVDLVGVGHGGDLQRLRRRRSTGVSMIATSIALLLEERPVVAPAEQALARGDRDRRALRGCSAAPRRRACRSRPRRGRRARWRAPPSGSPRS